MHGKRGVEQILLKWLTFFLENRKVRFTHNGAEIERNATRGTPQGGVLSPTLWNLAMYDLLNRLDQCGLTAIAFADDLTMLNKGKDPNTLTDILQHGIKIVESWCKDCGVRLSGKKSVAILYNRGTNQKPKPKKLKVVGTTVEWSTEVKYLGITLDEKLTFKSHLDNCMNSAKRALFMYRSLVGRNWGTKPQNMRWIWTCVVMPMLSYGATIWWKRTSLQYVQNTLRKLHRMALLMVAPVRTSTPTAGLEVMLHMMPPDLAIGEKAILTYNLIKDIIPVIWDGVGKRERGHLLLLSQICQAIGVDTLPYDSLQEQKTERLYHVQLRSFQKGTSRNKV